MSPLQYVAGLLITGRVTTVRQSACRCAALLLFTSSRGFDWGLRFLGTP